MNQLKLSYFWSKMENKENFDSSLPIKTEILEHHAEQPEYDPEIFEEIEIGKEFKTEYPKPEKIQSGDSKISGVSKSRVTKARFNCDYCNFSTNYKKNLASHIQVEHLPKGLITYKCGKCDEIFFSRNNLYYHSKVNCGRIKKVLRDVPTNHSCDHCDFETIYKHNMEQHMQAKHLPKDPNKCSKCDKYYLWRSDLAKHLKLCGKTMDQKRSLMRFSCEHCDYKVNRESQLINHVKAKHLPKTPSTLMCKKCGKTYETRANFLKHSKVCGKSEDFKNSLKRFTCDHCDYKFNSKMDLVRHMEAKHLPKDPNNHKCIKCEKSFSGRSGLRYHLKMICGQTNVQRSLKYSCEHCEFKTSYKGSIAGHIKAHHSNPKNCKKCGKKFLYVRTLSHHLKICDKLKDSNAHECSKCRKVW